MTSNPDESSYMRAAGKLVQDLNDRLDKAEEAREKSDQAARRRTFWQWIIAGTAVLSILGNALGTGLYFQQHDNAVSSCKFGNENRAKQTQVWDFFIGVLVSQPVSADTRNGLSQAKRYLVTIANGNPVLVEEATQFGSLLDRLAGNTKDPHLPQLVKSIESYIAGVNAPRDCDAAYKIPFLSQGQASA